MIPLKPSEMTNFLLIATTCLWRYFYEHSENKQKDDSQFSQGDIFSDILQQDKNYFSR